MHSRIFLVSTLIMCFIDPVFPQEANEFTNAAFLKKLNKDKSYSELKKKTILEFAHTPAGRWGEFVAGVDEKMTTQQKIIAFTFDACGGKNGSGYDKELIEYLHHENIPATLFVSGRWIDAQFSVFLGLSRDTLFEIENHGLNHKPCSVKGVIVYGIHGTQNVEEAFDEIEANSRKIEAITGRRPLYYRPAAAYIDEACAGMASRLGITTVTYQVLSGDAIPHTPVTEIENNVLKNVKPGAIIIMHFNHPERSTMEAMQKIVPHLRQMGYTFVLLNNVKLTSIRNNKKK
jgi:peptidoglycan/xylan/chitin deacetylase (PgdA/CDA1 family)